MLTRPWFTEEEVAAFNHITRTYPYCTSRINATNPPHGASAHPWHLPSGAAVSREVNHLSDMLPVTVSGWPGQVVVQSPDVGVQLLQDLHGSPVPEVDGVLMQIRQARVGVADGGQGVALRHATTLASNAQSPNWNAREDFHAAQV